VKVSGIIAVDSRDTAVDLCPIGKDLFGDPFFMPFLEGIRDDEL
jgi:hypothetical protein